MVLVAFMFHLYNKQIDKELQGIDAMGKCYVLLPPML